MISRRPAMRGAVVVLAAFAALVAWRVSRLPAPIPVATEAAAADIRVAYHVHTTRSDGTGTPEAVAAAAQMRETWRL